MHEHGELALSQRGDQLFGMAWVGDIARDAGDVGAGTQLCGEPLERLRMEIAQHESAPLLRQNAGDRLPHSARRACDDRRAHGGCPIADAVRAF